MNLVLEECVVRTGGGILFSDCSNTIINIAAVPLASHCSIPGQGPLPTEWTWPHEVNRMIIPPSLSFLLFISDTL